MRWGAQERRAEQTGSPSTHGSMVGGVSERPVETRGMHERAPRAARRKGMPYVRGAAAGRESGLAEGGGRLWMVDQPGDDSWRRRRASADITTRVGLYRSAHTRGAGECSVRFRVNGPCARIRRCLSLADSSAATGYAELRSFAEWRDSLIRRWFNPPEPRFRTRYRGRSRRGG